MMKPSSSAALRASALLLGSNFLPREFDQFGDEGGMLAQPFVALGLGALAVAGVGEEFGPLAARVAMRFCRRR